MASLNSLAGQAVFQSYSNPSDLTLDLNQNRYLPYPSGITVSNAPDYLYGFMVSFEAFHALGPEALDILLQAPDGQLLILASDVPRQSAGTFAYYIGSEAEEKVAENLDDRPRAFLPANYGLAIDSFPNIGPVDQPEPDPFSLIDINPNGQWNLYIVSDQSDLLTFGFVSDGWTLELIAGDRPACRRTGAPALVEADDFSVTLSWDGGQNNTLWDIFYTTDPLVKPDFETEATIAGIDLNNEYQLEGLLPGLTYYIHVRSNCGNGHVSRWSQRLTAQTEFNPCEYDNPVTLCDELRDDDPSLLFFFNFPDDDSGKTWLFSFTPPADGDYYLPGFGRPASYKASSPACSAEDWLPISDSKLPALMADTTYWILVHGPFGVLSPQPCAQRISDIWGSLSYTDSIVTQWPIDYSDSEVDFYFGATGITPPDLSTEPSVENAILDGQAHYTLTGLQAGTTYDLYVRSSCEPGRKACWEGPFPVETDAICLVPEVLQIKEVTTASASFDMTWSGISPYNDLKFSVTLAGGHPDRDQLFSRVKLSKARNEIQNGDTLSVTISAIPAYQDLEFYIKMPCIGTNQPWWGPFLLSASTLPPLEVTDVYCNQGVANFFGFDDEDLVQVNQACWPRWMSSIQENVFRFRAATTGTVFLLPTIYLEDEDANAAFFYKSATELLDNRGWSFLGCWSFDDRTSDRGYPPLEMEVEQDSTYYILSDCSRWNAPYNFVIRACENPCPAVDDIRLESQTRDSATFSWSPPKADVRYHIQYHLANNSQERILIEHYEDTLITLANLEQAAIYSLSIRTVCPDGFVSDWVNRSFLLGANPLKEDVKFSRCNPQFHLPGQPNGPAYGYESISLSVSELGEYLVAGNFPVLYLYANSFDAEHPEEDLVAGIYSADRPSLPYRVDTLVELRPDVNYILVGSGANETARDGYTLYSFQVDGPAEAILGAPDFDGLAAGPAGQIWDIGYLAYGEHYYICADTGGWIHFYHQGLDEYDVSDDLLMASIEDFPALLDAQEDVRMMVSAVEGASRITSPPADYLVNTSELYLMNRTWNFPIASEAQQPDDAVKFRLYYTDQDFQALRDSITAVGGQLDQHSDLYFYKINGVHDIELLTPLSGHPGIPAATSFDDPLGYWEYANGEEATASTWQYGAFKDGHYAEMLIRWFSGGGGGLAANGFGALDVTNSTMDQDLLEDITVFPNPLSDYLQVRASNSLVIRNLTLYDLSGRPLINQAADAATIRLPISTLMPGMYVLKVVTDQGEVLYKLVK